MCNLRKHCDLYHDGNFAEVRKAIKDGKINLSNLFSFYCDEYMHDLFYLKLFIERLS